jgi:hypothetical protein
MADSYATSLAPYTGPRWSSVMIRVHNVAVLFAQIRVYESGFNGKTRGQAEAAWQEQLDMIDAVLGHIGLPADAIISHDLHDYLAVI